MTSILTNNGAMVALQTLKGINSNLNQVQEQISTGKKVATAKDNSSAWAISKIMESDNSGLKSVMEGLSVAEATVGVARDGAEQIVGIYEQIKERVSLATSDSVDHAKLQTEINELAEQIGSVITNSQFNGVNLLNTNGIGGGATLDVTSALTRSDATTLTREKIEVASVDFEAGLAALGYAADAIDVSDAATARTTLETLETDIQVAVNGAAQLGAAQNRLSSQNEFLSKLSDSLERGVGALVDADMEEASARLQALQVQQQLGVQSLSIANQAPQSVLSLFR